MDGDARQNMTTTTEKSGVRLISALATIKAVCDLKSPKRVLSGVRVQADGNEVLLEATDLGTAVRIHVQSDFRASGEGSPIVDAVDFAKIATRLKSGTIEVDDDGVKIANEDGSRSFTLPAIGEPDEWPEIVYGAKNMRKVDGLGAALARASAFVAKDAGRFALHGIFVQPKSGTVLVDSTDGRRLSRTTLASKGRASSRGAILPAHVADIALRHGLDRLGIVFGDNTKAGAADRFCLSGPGIDVVVLGLRGSFPSVEEVIPKGSPATVVDQGALVEALQDAMLLTSRERTSVVVSQADDRLIIASRDRSRGKAEIGVPISGKIGGAFAINPEYLLQGVRSCVGPVRMLVSGAKAPILIRGDEDNYVHVVMPVSLSE